MSKYCEWIDVGFLREKLVCKQCDQENTTGNHKIERYCTRSNQEDGVIAIPNHYTDNHFWGGKF